MDFLVGLKYMKHIRQFFILLMVQLAFGCCTENHRAKYICFEGLDKRIQDTLKNLSIDVIDTMGDTPDLINFSGQQYELFQKEIGPWIYAQKLDNQSMGKSYWFKYNTPRPFVVTSTEIIYPTKYNIDVMGIESKDSFAVISIN